MEIRAKVITSKANCIPSHVHRFGNVQRSPLGALLPMLASALTLLVDKHGKKLQVCVWLDGKRELSRSNLFEQAACIIFSDYIIIPKIRESKSVGLRTRDAFTWRASEKWAN